MVIGLSVLYSRSSATSTTDSLATSRGASCSSITSAISLDIGSATTSSVGVTSGVPKRLIGLGSIAAVAGLASPIGDLTGLINGEVGINGLALDVGALMPDNPIFAAGGSWLTPPPRIPLIGRPPVAPSEVVLAPRVDGSGNVIGCFLS